MRKESQKEWTQVADEMNAAMNELEAAYEKTKSSIKKRTGIGTLVLRVKLLL